MNETAVPIFDEFNTNLRDHRKKESEIINTIRRDTEKHCAKLDAMVGTLSSIPDLLQAISTSLKTVEPGLINIRESLGGGEDPEAQAAQSRTPARTPGRNRETTLFPNPINSITRGDFLGQIQDILSVEGPNIRIQRIISTKNGAQIYYLQCSYC